MRPSQSINIVADGQRIDTIEYRRVSTQGQAAEDKSSPADQGAANAAIAARLGRKIGLTFADLGVSGATADRVEFQRMIAYCEEHKQPKNAPGYVLALNDSRFGRFGPDECAYWRHRLKMAGWIVQFAEGDDIQQPTAKAIVRSINSAQSEEYRRNLSANSRRGKRGTAEKGFWVTKAPFGYRRAVVSPPERARVLENGVPKADDEHIKLTIGPDSEADIIRRMFAEYDSGQESITTITRRLQSKGTRLRWSRSFVHRVLSNPAYAGDIVGGRVRHDYYADDYTPKRDQNEWYVTRDAHPPMVPRELFDRVQRRLAQRQVQTTAPDNAYALSGLVTCSGCGEPYVGGGGGRNRRDPSKRRRFYKDRGGNEPKKCVGKIGTISRHILEDAVVSVIANEVERPEVQAVIAEELDRLIEAEENGLRSGLNDAVAEKRKLEKKQSNLVDALADGTLTRDQAAPALSRISADLAAVSERERSIATVHVPNRLRTERERILAAARRFAENVRDTSGIALRELIAPWIQSAAFDKTARALSVTVRTVPITPALLLYASPGRDSP